MSKWLKLVSGIVLFLICVVFFGIFFLPPKFIICCINQIKNKKSSVARSLARNQCFSSLLWFVCQMVTIALTWHKCFDDGLRQPMQMKAGTQKYSMYRVKWYMNGMGVNCANPVLPSYWNQSPWQSQMDGIEDDCSGLHGQLKGSPLTLCNTVY